MAAREPRPTRANNASLNNNNNNNSSSNKMPDSFICNPVNGGEQSPRQMLQRFNASASGNGTSRGPPPRQTSRHVTVRAALVLDKPNACHHSQANAFMCAS